VRNQVSYPFKSMIDCQRLVPNGKSAYERAAKFGSSTTSAIRIATRPDVGVAPQRTLTWCKFTGVQAGFRDQPLTTQLRSSEGLLTGNSIVRR